MEQHGLISEGEAGAQLGATESSRFGDAFTEATGIESVPVEVAMLYLNMAQLLVLVLLLYAVVED